MTLLGFAANVPGIVPEVGFWSRAGLTNKCTNYNANPNGALTNMTLAGDAAATLTEVDDTAQLQIAGLFGADKPCANGKVFKLDNSAGVSNAWAVIEGGAGNTNAHTYSAYARTAGAGNGWLFLEDFTGTIATFAGGSYARRSGTTAINNALRKMIVGADAGTAVFFILNQFVEGSLPGPIIVTAGAAASVGGDALSFDSPITADEDFVAWVVVDFRLGAASSTLERPFWIDNGTSDQRVWLQRIGASGNINIGVYTNGTLATMPTAGSQAPAGRAVLLMRRRGGSFTAFSKDSAGNIVAGTEFAQTFPTGLYRLYAGSAGASAWPNSPVEFVGIRKGSFSDGDVAAILQAA